MLDSDSNTQRVLSVDFAKGKYLNAYLPLLEKLSELDCSNYLSIDQFKLNTTLFFFNIIPLKIPGYMHQPRKGTLKLDLKFSTAIEEPLTVLTYANFQNIMSCDPAKNFTIEQS